MKIANLVELDEAVQKVTANKAQANDRARSRAHSQQPQEQGAQPQQTNQQEQQPGQDKHTANKAKAAIKQPQQQTAGGGPETEVGKAIVKFAKENPQLVAQIKNRINRIGISESVDGEYPMITEIFGLGKPKTGMKYDDVISKWDAAGNPRDSEGIKKFLAGLGIEDESIRVILSNAGYEDSAETDNKKTMEQYEELQKQLRLLRKQDKATFVKEVKSILAILNQIGSAQ